MGILPASPRARRAFIIIPLMLLSACGIFGGEESSQPPKARHARHPKPEEIYQADAYLLHLSLARLALQASPTNVSASAADWNIARAYSVQKQNGNALQPTLILEYTLKGQAEHKHIAIPFDMPHTTPEFPDLESAMARLSPLPYTLYDLRPAVVSLPAPTTMDEEGMNAAVARKLVDDRLELLAKRTIPLSPMTQARIDLQLARFFIRHKYKDPAYIAVENAKQSLAMVEERSGDGADSRTLSREIEETDSLLHKTMPLTLDF